MAEENFILDDSDFDDAIFDIANEIAKVKAINTTAPSQKSDPQIPLKVEIELKKAESSSTNISKVLKTLQEVQVFFDNTPVAIQSGNLTTERKYVHHTKGTDQKFYPITITETVVVEEESLDYQNLTLEDLFEDAEPEKQPMVVVSQKKTPLDPCSIIPVRKSQPQLNSRERFPDMPPIKTVNIPDTISKNISQTLKNNEKTLLRNFLRMQKR